MKSKLLVLGASVMCLTGLTGCSSEFAVEMEHAGLNTLLGMGMAFFVLIIISLVISCFPLVFGRQNKTTNQVLRQAPCLHLREHGALFILRG